MAEAWPKISKSSWDAAPGHISNAPAQKWVTREEAHTNKSSCRDITCLSNPKNVPLFHEISKSSTQWHNPPERAALAPSRVSAPQAHLAWSKHSTTLPKVPSPRFPTISSARKKKLGMRVRRGGGWQLLQVHSIQILKNNKGSCSLLHSLKQKLLVSVSFRQLLVAPLRRHAH